MASSLGRAGARSPPGVLACMCGCRRWLSIVGAGGGEQRRALTSWRAGVHLWVHGTDVAPTPWPACVGAVRGQDHSRCGQEPEPLGPRQQRQGPRGRRQRQGPGSRRQWQGPGRRRQRQDPCQLAAPLAPRHPRRQPAGHGAGGDCSAAEGGTAVAAAPLLQGSAHTRAETPPPRGWAQPRSYPPASSLLLHPCRSVFRTS